MGAGIVGFGEICGIITLQMEIQLKDNFPRLIQGIRGWDLGTREREKRWEFGKVKLRVVNRSATLQPHTAFSRTPYVIQSYQLHYCTDQLRGLYLGCGWFALDL